MAWTRLGQLSAEMQTVADVALYGGGANVPTVSNTKAKTGAYSYRSSATPFGVACSTATVRGGFYLNHNGSLYDPGIVALGVGDSFILLQWQTTLGQFRMVAGYQQNSTSFYVPATASAATFSTVDQWYYIGFAAHIASTGGYVSFYVDGSRVLNWTGDTTVYKSNSASKEAASISGAYMLGAIQPSQTWSGFAYADDFYLDDATGEADVAPSARRFLYSPVDAAGSAAAWTPAGAATNYECVDDATSDGDTTYVKALSAGLSDTYNTAAITLPEDHAIAAVIPVAMAKKTDAGVATTLQLLAFDGALTTTSAAKALPAGYNVVWERWETQPDGSAWGSTATDFNAMEFGIKSAGSY